MKYRAKEFSEKVKTKRTIKDRIDLRGLSDRLGISHSTICRVENGSTPDIDTYCKLCKWLGAPAGKYLR